jgi:hypothetical protein
MKLYLVIWSLFFACDVFAHEDHALGEGAGHTLFHAVFLFVAALVIYKGLGWLLHKFKNIPR